MVQLVVAATSVAVGQAVFEVDQGVDTVAAGVLASVLCWVWIAVVLADEVIEGAAKIGAVLSQVLGKARSSLRGAHVVCSRTESIICQSVACAYVGSVLVPWAIVRGVDVGISWSSARSWILSVAALDEASQVLVVHDHCAHIVVKFRELALGLAGELFDAKAEANA